MTGTIVVELWLPCVVVSQVLVVMSLAVMSSVETLSGIVVIVDVAVKCVESDLIEAVTSVLDGMVLELGVTLTVDGVLKDDGIDVEEGKVVEVDVEELDTDDIGDEEPGSDELEVDEGRFNGAWLEVTGLDDAELDDAELDDARLDKLGLDVVGPYDLKSDDVRLEGTELDD